MQKLFLKMSTGYMTDQDIHIHGGIKIETKIFNCDLDNMSADDQHERFIKVEDLSEPESDMKIEDVFYTKRKKNELSEEGAYVTKIEHNGQDYIMGIKDEEYAMEGEKIPNESSAENQYENVQQDEEYDIKIEDDEYEIEGQEIEVEELLDIENAIFDDEYNNLIMKCETDDQIDNCGALEYLEDFTTMLQKSGIEKKRKLAKKSKPTVGKRYTCRYCKRGFSQKQNLKDHINTHTGERPFVCLQCGSNFASKSNLNRHKKIHFVGQRSDNNELVCDDCNMSFRSKYNLIRHITRTHSHLVDYYKLKPYIHNTQFECDFCRKLFYDKRCLAVHIGMHMPSVRIKRKRTFKCTQCPMKFTRNFHLKEHKMTRHTGEKPFQCLLCKQRFIRESYLQAHIMKHTPQQCKFCDDNFFTRQKLLSHIRIKHTKNTIKKEKA